MLKNLKIGIKTKLTLSIVLFVIIFLGVTTACMFFYMKNQSQNNTRLRLLDIVSVAALQIDAEKHSTLKIREHEETETYKTIKKTMQNIRDNATDIYYIYTMRENEKGEILFVIDAEEDLDDMARLGEFYTDASPFLKESFSSLKEPYVEDEFYTDKWGTWLTAYAPIYNKDGNKEGILGIDIKATNVISYEAEILFISLLLFVISSSLAVVIGIILSNRLTKSIISLTSAINKFSKGEDVYITSVGNDEITLLTETFNVMMEKIKNNQNQLKLKVEERTINLEKINKAMTGRELKMVELKKEIIKLKNKISAKGGSASG